MNFCIYLRYQSEVDHYLIKKGKAHLNIAILVSKSQEVLEYRMC